jgi:hypothetical protein
MLKIHLTELEPSDGVTDGVEGWGPENNTHHIGHDQENGSTHP